MKVGIVGCGFIAGFHLPHILRYEAVEAVTLVDVDRQRAERTGERFGIGKIYTDFERMLAEEAPDVVHVLTPPATHAKLATQAMEFGCHVLVEKPMALSLAEADAMVTVARKNGVKLCVDHNNLWEPLMQQARGIVDKGKVGSLLHVDACYNIDINRIRTADAGRSAKMFWLLGLPGGLLLDLLPHPVSILLHFLRDPVTISAVAKSYGALSPGLPDELRALFKGANATGYLSISLGTKPDCITVNVYGTAMSIHVNLSNLTLVTRKNRDIPKKIFRILDNLEQAAQLLSCTVVNGFKVFTGKMPLPDDVGCVIVRFYDSLTNGAPPPVTAEDGRAVVRATCQILDQIGSPMADSARS